MLSKSSQSSSLPVQPRPPVGGGVSPPPAPPDAAGALLDGTGAPPAPPSPPLGVDAAGASLTVGTAVVPDCAGGVPVGSVVLVLEPLLVAVGGVVVVGVVAVLVFDGVPVVLGVGAAVGSVVIGVPVPVCAGMLAVLVTVGSVVEPGNAVPPGCCSLLEPQATTTATFSARPAAAMNRDERAPTRKGLEPVPARSCAAHEPIANRRDIGRSIATSQSSPPAWKFRRIGLIAPAIRGGTQSSRQRQIHAPVRGGGPHETAHSRRNGA